MKASTLLLLAWFTIPVSPLHSQIVVFTFPGAAGNEATFAPDSQPLFATVSSMSRGTGLTASANSGTFSASAWTTGASLDLSDYYSFSITPNHSSLMSLSTLTLDERRSSTGIRDWVVRSSLDNFGSDLSHFAVPDDSNTRTGQTTTFGGIFANLFDGVEFRIYGYNAESGAGTWRIDNVQLQGSFSFSAVPEPQEYALVVGTRLLLFALVRRKRRAETISPRP